MDSEDPPCDTSFLFPWGEKSGPFQPGFADIHTVYIMHLNILSLNNPDQHVFSNKGPEEAMRPAGRFGGLKFPQRGAARAVVQISTEMGSAMPICHLRSQNWDEITINSLLGTCRAAGLS